MSEIIFEEKLKDLYDMTNNENNLNLSPILTSEKSLVKDKKSDLKRKKKSYN